MIGAPASAMMVAFLLCAVLIGTPGTANIPPVLELLESRYTAAHTLQVAFMERYSESGRFVRSEAGTAYFLRPGKMRWDYQVPEKNTFLVDGKYVWFYSPADRTATRMPAKQSEDWRTPLAFLTTHMKLAKLCVKIEPQSETPRAENGNSVFRCELRNAEDRSAEGNVYKRVLFEVSPEGELRRITVREEGGRELEFSFTGWKWNPQLDKSTFEFVAPRGVAIVDGVLSEAPGLRQ